MIDEFLTKLIDERIEAALRERHEEPKPQDELLTAKEACKLLKVSRPTLHRWKQAGVIPSVKIGGNIRYPKNKLIEYLKN